MTTRTRSVAARSGDIAVVLGTRPEIIKLASVVRALGPRARVVHTGQHWDDSMAGRFFTDLGIGEPHIRLSGMSGKGRPEQVAEGIAELTAHFRADRPAAVIVQGDTNSTSVGAQAASYLDIPVIHVEAGLRSHDRAMPEELNRLVVGALAELHCAATAANRDNLLREGVPAERIAVTGNTVVEATIASLEAAAPAQRAETGRPLVLATVHRPENTDDPEALRRVLEGLRRIEADVVLALHPRTEAAANRWGLAGLLDAFDVRRGLGHGDFLALASVADLIVSDSGGVQEEVTVLGKPLLVVRRSTERPESIDAGFARLVTPGEDIAAAAAGVLSQPGLRSRLAATPSPYGDGRAGAQIAQAALRLADAA
ncbi:non-hydrolyzing UDP-N-acetylglucosamine 2-epimerase [Leifsonia shinshuensis]|uniref:UDP-N-acetylglucosamine 2-epimerase (Non-hydrolyzing) n=1 Tax=Leifsonia shinshuensis TaxID=150026 RepID=A0A7G6Y9W7_9MICO|nr:UDP-N-acetylglucosamine 2-epimerase (non-hydrolyzing) [Leifsonia shinshuensis]QNE35282.1 UDP-N-acetylglucosamine 2-epimerase (non-hydrolyzing) [Leifsonia shinshuensis]